MVFHSLSRQQGKVSATKRQTQITQFPPQTGEKRKHLTSSPARERERPRKRKGKRKGRDKSAARRSPPSPGTGQRPSPRAPVHALHCASARAARVCWSSPAVSLKKLGFHIHILAPEGGRASARSPRAFGVGFGLISRHPAHTHAKHRTARTARAPSPPKSCHHEPQPSEKVPLDRRPLRGHSTRPPRPSPGKGRGRVVWDKHEVSSSGGGGAREGRGKGGGGGGVRTGAGRAAGKNAGLSKALRRLCAPARHCPARRPC